MLMVLLQFEPILVNLDAKSGEGQVTKGQILILYFWKTNT